MNYSKIPRNAQSIIHFRERPRVSGSCCIDRLCSQDRTLTTSNQFTIKCFERTASKDFVPTHAFKLAPHLYITQYSYRQINLISICGILLIPLYFWVSENCGVIEKAELISWIISVTVMVSEHNPTCTRVTILLLQRYLFYFYRDSTLTLVSILSTSVCFLILAFILSLIGTQSSERRAEQSRAARNPAAAARTAANNQYRYSNRNYHIWCWGAVMYFGIECFSTYFARNRQCGQSIRYIGWACSKKSSVNRKCR